MKIAITGGKGGTGKSTLATAIASLLAKDKKVLLADCDVDCPGDDLLLGIKLKKLENVESMVPVFDFEKCIQCGKCAKNCPENAIVFVQGKNPFFIPDQCIGCRACQIVCPTGAITQAKQTIGEIFLGKKNSLVLLSGKMKPGIEESSLVVNAVKKKIALQEKDFDYVITDTAAGTHCPVISALLENDCALAVTEPTPLGAHDLDLILSLNEKLKIKTSIIINRSDIGSEKIIEKIAQEHKAEIIAKIPYSKEFQRRYCAGISIEHKMIEKISDWIKKY